MSSHISPEPPLVPRAQRGDSGCPRGRHPGRDALAEPPSADTLPDYAPVPPSALGPAVNAQGYFAGRVEKNLYWVTTAPTRRPS